MRAVEALVCLGLGILAGWLLKPDAVPTPASQPVCREPVVAAPAKEERLPSSEKKRVVEAPPPLRAPDDKAAIRACFSDATYAGASFVLRLETKSSGEVQKAHALGAEFMSDREKKCVIAAAKQWTFGLGAPPEVVMNVSL